MPATWAPLERRVPAARDAERFGGGHEGVVPDGLVAVLLALHAAGVELEGEAVLRAPERKVTPPPARSARLALHFGGVRGGGEDNVAGGGEGHPLGFDLGADEGEVGFGGGQVGGLGLQVGAGDGGALLVFFALALAAAEVNLHTDAGLCGGAVGADDPFLCGGLGGDLGSTGAAFGELPGVVAEQEGGALQAAVVGFPALDGVANAVDDVADEPGGRAPMMKLLSLVKTWLWVVAVDGSRLTALPLTTRASPASRSAPTAVTWPCPVPRCCGSSPARRVRSPALAESRTVLWVTAVCSLSCCEAVLP